MRSGAYERTIAAMDGGVTVIARACPLFVPLVENSRYRVGDCVVETVAREYLEPLKAEGIDTLILGCTHYPLLEEVVAKIMGPDVTLVDSGAQAAGSCGTRWPGTTPCAESGRAASPCMPAISPAISARWPLSFYVNRCRRCWKWILTNTKERETL